MTKLLVVMPNMVAKSHQTQLGGTPIGPVGFSWPRCATCEAPLAFAGRIGLEELTRPDQVILLFHCQSDTRGCEEWNADSGANQAIVIDAEGAVDVQVPELGGRSEELRGVIVLRRQHVALVEQEDSALTDKSTATQTSDTRLDASRLKEWLKRLVLSEKAPPLNVVGKFGGSPEWIQYDETPVCECGALMRFVCQLEHGLSNYGTGRAYVFVCLLCVDQAKWLWQC